MKCPYCGFLESRVIDSRPADENSSIRRRRECLGCMRRFTSYERVEGLPAMVVKKDGRRQSFDREKILAGMVRACEKRPVPMAKLERIVIDIEQDLQNSSEREIYTSEIGQRVMDELRKIDQVAYVRFASVYRQFKDIDSFMTELTKLLAER
ncbi:MAG: transcriptional regulator NrdR [Oscillibacter sp.]|nr:transcriptional regulator NrdR [Oscillibacter sp.]